MFAADPGCPLNPNNVYREEGERGSGNRWHRTATRIRIHDLRHTHASHLIAWGWNIPKVSRRLGHANPAITMALYARVISDDDGEDIQTPAAFAFTGTA